MGYSWLLLIVGGLHSQSDMSFDTVRNEYKGCRLRLSSLMSQPVLKNGN
jgi:hypothetical protein